MICTGYIHLKKIKTAIGLTSIVMKCFERLVRNFITLVIGQKRPWINYSLPIPSLTTNAITHLSAHGPEPSGCEKQVSIFLTHRPQAVRWADMSHPHRWSFLLYSLYTYDCMATFNSTTAVKFADDTGLPRGEQRPGGLVPGEQPP